MSKEKSENGSFNKKTGEALLSSTDPITLEDVVKRCNINLEYWEVKEFIANSWDTTFKVGEEIEHRTNYQAKAKFLKKQEKINQDQIIKAFEDRLLKIKSQKPKPIKYAPHKNTLLEISVPDLHLSKLACKEEVGENYDTKIACDRFNNAVDDLVTRVRPEEVAVILLPIGNDFFNTDNEKNTTTAGTPQDSDTRWFKTFNRGCDLIIQNIEKLIKIAPVKVAIIPGNHDRLRCFYLGKVLQAYFRNYDNVEIDNTPPLRKYCRFGKNLIGMTHGDKEKKDRLPNIMAAEQPEAWGATKYKFMQLGHLHTEKVTEIHGVKIQILPSLCATDAWHHENGYIGNIKSAVAMQFDAEQGLIATFYHNL